MERFFNSVLGKTLRYILILPISYFALNISEIFASNLHLLSPAPFNTSSIIFHAITSGGISAFCFVFSGTTVAPHFKIFISIILSITIILLLLINIFHHGNQVYINNGIFGILSSWEYMLKMFSAIVGAIIANVMIFNESQ